MNVISKLIDPPLTHAKQLRLDAQHNPTPTLPPNQTTSYAM